MTLWPYLVWPQMKHWVCGGIGNEYPRAWVAVYCRRVAWGRVMIGHRSGCFAAEVPRARLNPENCVSKYCSEHPIP